MNEPEKSPDPGFDRTPGRLVVIALVNLYAGFALSVAGLTELGGLLGGSVIPLIIVAIILRLGDPNRNKSR